MPHGSPPAADRLPLYQGGRRRAGKNLWGFDPDAADLLTPAKLPVRWPYFAERARRHHADRELWQQRGTAHKELRKRRAGGDRIRVRGDRRADLHRFGQFLATYAQTNGDVGLWINGELRPFTLKEIAERLGIPFTEACRRRRSQAPCRVERVIQDGVEAGWIWRHANAVKDAQGGDWVSDPATLRVTRAFWEVSGAEGARQSRLKLIKRRRDRAEAQARRYEEDERRDKSDQEVRRETQRQWHAQHAAERQEAKRVAWLARALADGGPMPRPPDDDD